MKILSRLKTVYGYEYGVADREPEQDWFTRGVYFDLYFNSKKYPKLFKKACEWVGEEDVALEKPVKGCDCMVTDVYLDTAFYPDAPYDDFCIDYGDGEGLFLTDDEDTWITNLITKSDCKKIQKILNDNVKEISYDADDPYVSIYPTEVFLN